MHRLENLGFNENFYNDSQKFISQGFLIGRIIEEYKEIYKVRTELFEMSAEISGKFMFNAECRADYPAVGDWVVISTYDQNSKAIIHDILPRQTMLARKFAGKRTDSQIIAANIDYVFIVNALNRFNLRTLERYMVVVRESGAKPIILLSKSDLCPQDELSDRISQTEEISLTAPVIAYSSLIADGVDKIRACIKEDETFCFIGPSGVGKSTLINKLAGKEILTTQDIREVDGKGRHTTTSRQLIILENGGIMIDTPGMRELGLGDVSEGISDTFTDLEVIAKGCFFTDCTHIHEPDCAILKALEEGTIDQGRYTSYMKLSSESAQIAGKSNTDKLLARKSSAKKLSKVIKNYYKHKKVYC